MMLTPLLKTLQLSSNSEPVKTLAVCGTYLHLLFYFTMIFCLTIFILVTPQVFSYLSGFPLLGILSLYLCKSGNFSPIRSQAFTETFPNYSIQSSPLLI